MSDEEESGSNEGTRLGTEESESDENRLGNSQSISSDDLPFIYRRDTVKDGRQQKTIHIQSSTSEDIEDFITELEEHFDRKVYKIDVEEAALQVAINESPEDVARKLNEWGYGL